MALSKSVEESLKEADSNLRNALAYAARQERPMVCREIAKIICEIQTLQDTDNILDKLESRSPGDSGMFGSFFNDDDE
jgi:AMMECR1 domain-containing protein